jgi:hypothetical protein
MLEEREEGPTSIDVTDRQSEEREEGPTSIDVTDKQISIEEETPVAVPQVEKVQEQTGEVQKEPRLSKKKRRTITYLSQISKQAVKNGNQINRIITLIQSLQKQKKQTKSAPGSGVALSHLQSIKQIQFQLRQLQKQVARIQKGIQRIRRAPAPKTRFRKLTSISTAIRPRPKKSRSVNSAKARRGRRK